MVLKVNLKYIYQFCQKKYFEKSYNRLQIILSIVFYKFVLNRDNQKLLIYKDKFVKLRMNSAAIKILQEGKFTLCYELE